MSVSECKNIITMIRKSIRDDIKSGRKENNNYRIHASSVYDFCAYRLYIANKLKVNYSPEQPLDTGRAFTFKLGRKIQDIITDSIISYAPEYVLGNFKCTCCGYSVISTADNCTCKECSKTMVYDEIVLEYNIPNTKYFISGSVDCFIAGAETFTPVEIKGLRQEDFIGEPIFKYEIQAGIYSWLVNKSTTIKELENKGFKFNKEGSLLLYVAKQHNQNPIRGFFVKRNKTVVNILNKLIQDVIALEAGAPKKVCNSKASILAKSCPFKKECWG